MARAIDVAMFLVYLRDVDAIKRGDYNTLSNLKLQKLLYYCHGGHYRWDNERLISDNVFEAWEYGPVIRTIYYKLRHTCQNDLPNLKQLKCRDKYRNWEHYEKSLSVDERETIKVVWGQLKNQPTFDLVSQTQSEPPWKKARDSGILFLSDQDIRNHFREDITVEPIKV
ncbi:DUF4065 domain-containing protein [Exiguobacterium sp. SH5S4]|uniref:Panacea domain-containing protein n=1 Tax=Exiguobacterium sp. SH5S4 TaxID=2510961 RepID=UPI00103ACB52|nr:type II toxin-antitoxin system antitoxin SocA domain-containing protein [Exiguobacterium sp. SH5S4]TCI26718.1 DUF4065 domain-containing protein [Exiguobacterium sp. SH5S4]